MLLYAGKFYKLYKYSIQICKDTVTKLYRWDNQQIIILVVFKIIFYAILAGLSHLNMRISETLRSSISLDYNKPISIHTSNVGKPCHKDLGHYLAGLIDGDGHFSKIGQLVISYHEKDKSAAYWLKSQIGYGSVREVKGKKALIYVISHSDGLLKVLHLINGKLRTETKYDQVIYLLKNHNLISKFLLESPFIMNCSDDFNNYWLTGFIDSDGSFQIKIISRKDRKNKEVRLKLQIAQKDKRILDAIKYFFVGPAGKGVYIGTRVDKPKGTTTYYFETTSFKVFKNVINYVEHFPLISNKRLNYMWIRKAYLLVQTNEHLTIEGIKKIQIYKEKMGNTR